LQNCAGESSPPIRFVNAMNVLAIRDGVPVVVEAIRRSPPDRDPFQRDRRSHIARKLAAEDFAVSIGALDSRAVAGDG
jgi:hypothetical protein